jgi:hypothetical protein
MSTAIPILILTHPYSTQLIRTFLMDGNFSAKHMCCRSGEMDAPLSSGMAYMANPNLYKKHLLSGKEFIQVCDSISIYDAQLMISKDNTCNTYRAIEMANSSWPHLDVTGIRATTCCHGFFVPTSVVDFQKGERYIQSRVKVQSQKHLCPLLDRSTWTIASVKLCLITWKPFPLHW